jgi:hypothetical protein
MPASVFLRIAGRRGGVDNGDDSSGGCSSANSGSRGSEVGCGVASGVLGRGPQSSRGGVWDLGDPSNPGGREMDEDVGAIRSRVRRAPALAELAVNGEMAMQEGGSPYWGSFVPYVPTIKYYISSNYLLANLTWGRESSFVLCWFVLYWDPCYSYLAMELVFYTVDYLPNSTSMLNGAMRQI